VAFSVAVLAGFPVSPQQDVLTRFEEMAEEGRTRDGIELLVSWLESNVDAEGFPQVLDRLLHAETSVESLRQYLALILESDAGPEVSRLLLERLAWIEEAVGRLEAAHRYYAAAAELASGSERSALALSAARILFQEGFFEEASREIALIVAETPGGADTEAARGILGQAAVLQAHIYLMQDLREEANEKFLGVLDHEPPWEAEPAALLGLVQLHGDDPEQANRYLQRLETDYPDAPEHELALSYLRRGARVRYPLTPGSILMGGRESEEPGGADQAADGEGREEGGQAPVMVQTGSFTMKENAESMLAELLRLGFPAQVREVEIRGKVYYRVLVGELTGREQIRETITRLKENGFEGFQTSAD